jgi:hypothetical protein
MALTTIKTGAISDDAVTEDKIANAINTARAANTAKDLTALSASNLTSGTVPDARFPATLPAVSAANLTSVPAANITGTLPAISGANLTGISTTPADGSITQAKLNFPVANRNLIINGAMQVAQRGTSSTSGGYQTVDRFQVNFDSGLTEAPEQEQGAVASGTTPYTLGFRKSLKITNGNQTSQDANDYLQIAHKIEAQDIAQSGWNYTSSSSNITLSFWVKASIAQTMYARLNAEDASRAFSFAFSATTSWTKITKTISGDSNLVFNNDTGVGLALYIIPFYGTSYTTSGHTNDSWIADSGSDQVTDMANTWFSGNDATLEVTGVQLEVGSVATDFEHRSFGEELALCQRYYYHLDAGGHANSNLPDKGGYARATVDFPTTMRATPTAAVTGSFSWYGSYTKMSGHRNGTYTFPTCAFSAEL